MPSNKKSRLTNKASNRSPSPDASTPPDHVGRQHHVFFAEARQRPDTRPYDTALSQALRDGMLAVDLEGRPMDMTTMSNAEIVKNIEHLEPLIRPYGCGPMAPANWIVLRTYQKIAEVRDEIRCDEMGLATGDRSLKRAYQQALRDIARYEAATGALRTQADAAGLDGVPPEAMRGVVVGRLRCPAAATEHAFAYLMDKHWHRYLLPFGCFFYERPTVESRGWTEWKAYMIAPKNSTSLLINPYSVTAADVLYLCNTIGYLKRFAFVVGTIIWAKKKGVNVLRHRRKHTDPTYRLFVSLEKHLHLFGSLYMHRRVLEMNNQAMGGNWTETIDLLSRLEAECYGLFNLLPHCLDRHLENMIVDSVKGSTTTLTNAFPKAGKITDKSK